MARDPKTTRGYRNKNPGNIDWNARNPWQGQVGIEATGNPPRFAVFESHEFGIRALAALLTTYYDRHGLNTVRKIINRWAPPNENATSEYVLAVSRFMQNQPDDVLDLHTYAHMRPLAEAIIKHELGGVPYTAAVLDEGLRRAGIVKPVTTLTQAAGTRSGQSAGAITAAVVAAAPAAPIISAMGGLPQWTAVALIAAVAVIALAVVLTKRKDA
jgi:hypothetical protein